MLRGWFLRLSLSNTHTRPTITQLFSYYYFSNSEYFVFKRHFQHLFSVNWRDETRFDMDEKLLCCTHKDSLFYVYKLMLIMIFRCMHACVMGISIEFCISITNFGFPFIPPKYIISMNIQQNRKFCETATQQSTTKQPHSVDLNVYLCILIVYIWLANISNTFVEQDHRIVNSNRKVLNWLSQKPLDWNCILFRCSVLWIASSTVCATSIFNSLKFRALSNERPK